MQMLLDCCSPSHPRNSPVARLTNSCNLLTPRVRPQKSMMVYQTEPAE